MSGFSGKQRLTSVRSIIIFIRIVVLLGPRDALRAASPTKCAALVNDTISSLSFFRYRHGAILLFLREPIRGRRISRATRRRTTLRYGLQSSTGPPLILLAAGIPALLRRIIGFRFDFILRARAASALFARCADYGHHFGQLRIYYDYRPDGSSARSRSCGR